MTDKEGLDRLLTLSDEKLKAKITNAASAVGADSRQLEASLSDIGKIRNMISNLTQSDIDRLILTFGKENAQKISEIIKSKDNI